jgi:hypothetical protein
VKRKRERDFVIERITVVYARFVNVLLNIFNKKFILKNGKRVLSFHPEFIIFCCLPFVHLGKIIVQNKMKRSLSLLFSHSIGVGIYL